MGENQRKLLEKAAWAKLPPKNPKTDSEQWNNNQTTKKYITAMQSKVQILILWAAFIWHGFAQAHWVCAYICIYTYFWSLLRLQRKLLCLSVLSDRKESGTTLGVNRLIPYAEDHRICAWLRLKQNTSLEPCFHHQESSPLASHVTCTPSLQQPRSAQVWLFSALTWLKWIVHCILLWT